MALLDRRRWAACSSALQKALQFLLASPRS
jgi:hypothetical protein